MVKDSTVERDKGRCKNMSESHGIPSEGQRERVLWRLQESEGTADTILIDTVLTKALLIISLFSFP